jgi:hypothetical protein
VRRAASLAGLIVFFFFWLFPKREPRAQSPAQLSTTVKAFVRVDAPVVVLAHVRVIVAPTLSQNGNPHLGKDMVASCQRAAPCQSNTISVAFVNTAAPIS